MAHINSIALGKMSGKLGNISTSYSNSKCIARSIPNKTVRKQSDKLLISKKKYRNVYVLYSLMSKSLKGWYVLKTQKESISNMFLRIMINRLPYAEDMTANQMFSHLSGLELYYRKRVWITAIEHFPTFLRVRVDYINGVILSNTYLSLSLVNKNSTGILNIEKKIPTSDIVLGHFDIPTQDFVFTNYMIYLYVKDKSWTSVINFF